MARTILEILGGKIKKGKKFPQESYRKFEPLFEALKKYITIIRIEGNEVIFIDVVPLVVLLSLSTELQKLYKELLAGDPGGPSPVVHLPSCAIIITK